MADAGTRTADARAWGGRGGGRRWREHLDRFALYRLRLVPLEAIKQNPKYHPEGDALYHSLQVFHLAREARPYDEEFLLAALLHDVGKAIDPQDHCAAGVEPLRGAVTERTLWLIEHHMDLLPARERALTARARRELEASEYLDDLRLLRELDDAGRVAGVAVDTLDEVLAYSAGPRARGLSRPVAELRERPARAPQPGQDEARARRPAAGPLRPAPPAAWTDMPWMSVATKRAQVRGVRSRRQVTLRPGPLEALAKRTPRSRPGARLSSWRMVPAASPHAQRHLAPSGIPAGAPDRS